jgi:hypothetical protein
LRNNNCADYGRGEFLPLLGREIRSELRESLRGLAYRLGYGVDRLAYRLGYVGRRRLRRRRR